MNGIDRRSFLKKTAATAAATALFPTIVPGTALGADGAVAPSERIVMGCIGVGGQGTHNMNAFMNIPGVQVVAVCDVERASKLYYGGGEFGREPAKKKVEEFYASREKNGAYKGCEAYKDFEDLLARPDIDAVTVCPPDHWHALISIAAAKAGKDIYCEKPLANTVVEGRAICDAVERYGRVLQCGSHERSNRNTRFAAELVRNERIGKLHTIRINMPNNDPHHLDICAALAPRPIMAPPESLDYDRWLGHTPWAAYTPMRSHFFWRFILTYGGGEMTDRGAHIIDLGQLGNNTDHTGPIEFEGTGEANADGLFNAFMRYKFAATYANGVRMIGESVAPRGLKFEGDKGWIFIHIHGGHLEAEPASLLKEIIEPGEIHLGRSPGHREDFIEKVRSRGATMATAEIGQRTGTICHLFNIAMRLGRKLKWDPVKERVIGDDTANGMLSCAMRPPWAL